MYAVLKTGGKQYRVEAGDVLRVEKLDGEAGETVRFGEVMMIGGGEAAPRIGAPMIDGAAVEAEVIAQIKGEKVIHYVRRRRKHSSARRKGHRQKLTLVRVTGIMPEGAGARDAQASAPRAGQADASGAGASAPSAPKASRAKASEAQAAPETEGDDVAASPVGAIMAAGASIAATAVETALETAATVAEAAAEAIGGGEDDAVQAEKPKAKRKPKAKPAGDAEGAANEKE